MIFFLSNSIQTSFIYLEWSKKIFVDKHIEYVITFMGMRKKNYFQRIEKQGLVKLLHMLLKVSSLYYRS